MENDLKELAKKLKKIEQSIKKYEAQNESLPKGTIFVRKIHKKSFAYRNRRIDGKVISEYLGPLGREYVDSQLSQSKRYKKNNKMIKKLKKNLHQISKEASKKIHNHELVDFAVSINKTDSIEPSKKAKRLLLLLEEGVIDLETYEFAIDRMYANV